MPYKFASLRRIRARLLNPLLVALVLGGLFAPAAPALSAPAAASGSLVSPSPNSLDWSTWLRENNIDEATYGGDPNNPVAPLGGAPMPYSGSPILGPAPDSQVTPQAAPNVCDTVDPAQVKTFSVSAIDVRITVNRFGDNDPLGMMYVLDENIPAVRAQENKPLPDRVSIGLRDDPIQPLVIRANVGDCVIVNFTNRLASGNASMNVRGLSVAATELGSNLGLNPDSTVPPGKSITYHWLADNRRELEGSYVFRSLGDPRRQVSHGLFGVINVEPPGSTYLNVITGQPLKSGWEAMIVDPNGRDFREDTIMYHEFGDESFNMKDAGGGSLPLNDFLGVYRPGSRALNYRSEPFFRRQELAEEVLGHEDESQSYGYYMFGDPATPFPRGYLG
ncbi:MAG: multicopper oxidase domain-containing protein, partial [Chloroflexi bacterium]|nr:multicopper oxidase domain-containing protein [Chloroflexota bacterium]